MTTNQINALQLGIASFKAGDKSQARIYLLQAVREDPNNEQAWGWLSNTEQTMEERVHCLREVVRINPQNSAARKMVEEYDSTEWQRITPASNTGTMSAARPVPTKPKKTQAALGSNPGQAAIKKKSSFLFPCVILIGLGAAAVAGMAYIYVSNLPDATQCVEVEANNFCLIRNGGGNTYVSGVVKNICKQPITRVVIEGQIFDPLNNQILDNLNGMIDHDLQPGQTSVFDLIESNTYLSDTNACRVDVRRANFVK